MNDDLKVLAENIHLVWDKALSKNDVESLLKLYSPNVTIEGYLN